MKKIDTCGMSCPQPVLMAKKGLEQSPEGVEVIVDNTTAKTNVERFLISAGCAVSVEDHGELTILKGKKA